MCSTSVACVAARRWQTCSSSCRWRSSAARRPLHWSVPWPHVSAGQGGGFKFSMPFYSTPWPLHHPTCLVLAPPGMGDERVCLRERSHSALFSLGSLRKGPCSRRVHAVCCINRTVERKKDGMYPSAGSLYMNRLTCRTDTILLFCSWPSHKIWLVITALQLEFNWKKQLKLPPKKTLIKN